MQTKLKTGAIKPKAYNSVHTASSLLEPKSVQAALGDAKWSKAMFEKYTALMQNKTWSLVPSSNDMNILGNKWVFRTKYHPDGSISKFKARLVVNGFQQTPGLDFFDTYSPVIKASTIRVIFTLAVTYSWDIQQMDINNAFLNGEFQETAYMEQPAGFVDQQHPSFVCKLHKALYGLKQAPRAWFSKLRGALLGWGFINSRSNVNLFYKTVGSHLLLLLVYVDDILITGSSSALIHKLISDFNSTFALKTLGSVNYFLGFEVLKNSSGLLLTQTKYVTELLNKTNMVSSKPCATPISFGTKLSLHDGELFSDPFLYRSVIGALQYLTHTRPDISFIVTKVSQFLKAPTIVHWQACKRVLRYLKGTTYYGLLFKPSSSLQLEAFCDADWASSIDDKKSTSGCCVYLGGNLITWSSNK
ncbi:hypothetical protein ACOSQ4_005398 [Xanthoceras sorbifolium]